MNTSQPFAVSQINIADVENDVFDDARACRQVSRELVSNIKFIEFESEVSSVTFLDPSKRENN